MSKIYHIAKRSEWESAKVIGVYEAESLKKQGFIHCSKSSQLVKVANENFPNDNDLVLLEMDDKRINSEVKYEDLYGSHEDYPHIYGQIKIGEVERVFTFIKNSRNSYFLPKEIDTSNEQ